MRKKDYDDTPPKGCKWTAPELWRQRAASSPDHVGVTPVLRRKVARKPPGSPAMRLEYRDQKKVTITRRCPECKEMYTKTLMKHLAAKNKLCGKTKCKLSDQNKRTKRTHERRKRQRELFK